jgi:ADP-ribose pyrophosphatase YjhB (NUDIX family)
MFVLSTVHADHFATQAAAHGLDRFFERVYLGVPDKRARIRGLLEENQLDPRATLYVGDMQHDIETAKHGAIFSCAVLTGYTTLESLRASEPDLIVEHLGELQHLLQASGWSLEGASTCPSHSQRAYPLVTVGALIFSPAQRVLIVRTHKWSNLWGIPGGKVRWGEPSLEALRREIKEETNLEVTDIRFVMVQECIHSREFYRDAHFVLLNYTCRCLDEGGVKLNEEAQEYRWVSQADARALPLNQPTRTLLDAVISLGSSA